MHIAIVTLFPEMLSAVTDFGISGRAVKQDLVKIASFNPRNFTDDKHSTVDDRPYGGGPGMVMLIEPLRAAINAAKQWLQNESQQTSKVVYLSPQGRLLRQDDVAEMAQKDCALVLVAGRYEGVDERLLQLEVDEEWSIGDYVVSGGELPAMVLVDAIVRLLPGALGDSQSAEQDSFAQGLLDCPHYTRPEDYQGQTVPEVLLSGNHAAIRRWRLQESLRRTRERRPDLLAEKQLTEEEQILLREVELRERDAD